MAKTHTSNEVKQRWESKAYSKYLVRFRHDTDEELIQFIDENKDHIGMTQIFREAMELYVKAQKERG